MQAEDNMSSHHLALHSAEELLLITLRVLKSHKNHEGKFGMF